MRRFHLLIVASTISVLAASAFAENTEGPAATPEAAPAVVESSTPTVSGDVPSGDVPGEATDDLAWENFDDPTFDPEAAAEDTETTSDLASNGSPEGVVASADDTFEAMQDAVPGGADIELTSAPAFEMSGGVVLGPQGVDDQGRTGRLHTVAKGDTLWDLAAAYLGTAWVWPSVWIDNDDIANPHRISPGDRIWITANEMRVVSASEAESFLAPVPVEDEMAAGDSMEIEEIEPMPVIEEEQPLAALEAEDPSSLEAFPVAVAGEEAATMDSGRYVTVSRRAAMGFVTADDMAGASSIVDSSVERTFLAAGDMVVLGMGEGDVEIGDQFTIFETIEEVRDVESNRILGHHVDILGWLEVRELTGDTALAEIRESFELVSRGARVMVREITPKQVTTRTTPDAIEGKIVFLPSQRTTLADGGYVYLNRGEFHGVEVGSELEVFDPGMIVNDRSRRVDVRTPDFTVAKLVVVSVTAESSVAFVVNSNRELVVGDDVRPRVARMAQR